MAAPAIRPSLARDERGSSLVELALFAPILATLLLGAIDLGQGLSARHDLQQAANRSMELAMSHVATADPDTGVVSYDFLRQAALAAVADAKLGPATVTLSQWRECNGTRQTVYDAVCPSDATGKAQEVARYVRVHIDALYTPTFRFGPIAMGSAARPDGKVPMAAEAAVRIQ